MVDVPFTENASNTLPVNCRFAIAGSFAAGDQVTIEWSSATVSSPCGPFAYAVQLLGPGFASNELRYSDPSSAGSATWTVDVAGSAFYAVAYTSGYCSPGSLHNVTQPGVVSYCPYGGQSAPGANVTWVIGSATIDVVAAAALAATGQLEFLPYVETALAALEGTIPFAIDCSVVPPAGGNPLDLTNPATVSPSSLLTWFQRAAWNYFCQCAPAPGTTSPIPPSPPPPPVLAPPGATTPAPMPVCDNMDLCSYLGHLEKLIAQLGGQLQAMRSDVQLIQRQKVPFAYVLGVRHFSLEGAGTFAVQGILGLAVETTTLPAYLSSDNAPVASWFKLGEVSWGTVDGWQARHIVTHNPHLFTGIEGDITQVAYQFAPGVVANIVELVREA